MQSKKLFVSKLKIGDVCCELAYKGKDCPCAEEEQKQQQYELDLQDELKWDGS